MSYNVFRHLWSVFWRFAVAGAYFNVLKRKLEKVIEKRYVESQDFFKKDMPKILKSSREDIKEIIQDSVDSMNVEHVDLDFTDTYEETEERKSENYDRAIDICLDMLDGMIQYTSSDFKNAGLILFLSYAVLNECYYPNKTAFPYEFRMMSFSKYGSLKHINKDISFLLIGGFLIIRMLICEILLKDINSKSAIQRKNTLIIASMVYQTFVAHFDGVLKGHKEGGTDMQVMKSRRIMIGEDHVHIDSTITRIDVGNKGQLEMVGGMIPLKEMGRFERDRNGIGLVKEYILKVLDNLYQHVELSYRERKSMIVMNKILLRRKLGEKMRGGEEYKKKLEREVDDMKEKYLLATGDIDRLASTSNNKLANTVSQQYNSGASILK